MVIEPVTVEIEPEQKTNNDVEQRVYVVAKQDKYRLLQDILREEPIDKVMIFANRRDQVRRLYDHLKKMDTKWGCYLVKLLKINV